MTYPFTSGTVVTADMMNQMGLHLITPTSVTGGTLSGATVTATTASSLSVDGVFSGDFDHYRIVFTSTPSVGLPRMKMRFRSGGTDNSSANYQYTNARLYINNAIDLYSSGATSMDLGNGGIASYPAAFTAEVFQPYSSTPTPMSFDSANFEGSSAGVRWWGMGGYKSSASFDGFTIYPGSGTINATLRVYGYSNG